MIDNIITAYLHKNKRLVVPEFGAFIHKDDGEVVFVEFLKKDDGVLTGLLGREYSMDETEARGLIDEYVFNIRRTVGTTGKYAVEGLGTLRTDANGLYALSYDPRVRREHVEIAPPAAVDEPMPEPEEPVMRVVAREMVVVDETVPSVGDDIIMDGRDEDADSERESNTIEFVFPTRKPAQEPAREPEPPKQPQPEEKKVFTLNDLYSIPASEERAPERPSPRPAAHPKPERPAPPVRHHETRPAEHTPRHEARPAAASTAHSQPRPKQQQLHPSRLANRRSGGRSKADWVMIIAILVALFALGTMIYGMLSKPDQDIKPTNDQIENVEFLDGDTSTELPENDG